jgi:filamentous hemagglutinin family protein
MKAKSVRSKAARPQNLQHPVMLKKSSLFVAIASLLGGHAATAGPEGGQVVNGVGSITQTDASSTLISQGSDRLGINWQSFNVAEHESVRFEQPSSTSIALNRIFDQNPSQILGALDANGHVFLINPNGMVFGEGAQINVAGLVASSLDLSQEDFAAANFKFTGNDAAGLVVNRGLIQAATGGSVTLLGGSVANEGVIIAELGQVNLAAGARASLDFTGDGLLFFEVDGALLANNTGADAAVSNSGTIQANGGSVLLTAAAARGVFSQVVNNQGLVSATRIENHGGVIRLVGNGGDVLTSGTLDASGQGGAGGTVQVLGDRVGLTGSAVVDVSGDTGGGSAQIGGGFQGADPNVKNAEATFVGANTTIDASAGGVGNGGDVVVWADGITRFNGKIDARGGAVQGDGGSVEVSGKETLLYRGQVDARAVNGQIGTLLLDPLDIEIHGGANVAGDQAILDFGVNDNPAAAYTISEQSLEETTAAINLEARRSITTTATATFTYTTADADEDGNPDTPADGIDDEGVGVVLLKNGVSLAMLTRNSTDGNRDGDGDPDTGDGPDGAGVIDIDGRANFTDLTPALTFRTQGADANITVAAGDLAGADQPASVIAGNLEALGGARIAVRARNDVTVNNVNAGDGNQVTITVGTDGLAGRTLTIGGTVAGNPEDSLLTGVVAGHTLVAGGGVDAFVLGATDTLNGITIDNFSAVNGGGGADTFAINASKAISLDGGEDGDTFTFGAAGVLTGAGVRLTGGVDAVGDDNDILNVSANTAALTVSLTAAANEGFSGTATTVLPAGTFAAIDTIVGGGTGVTGDTLQGLVTPTTSSVWRLTTTTTTYNDGTEALTFSGITTAEGRAAADVLQGNDAATNVADDAFTVTAAGSVTLAGQAYTGIDTLSGRGGADTFNLNADFGGAVNGGAHNDAFLVNATQGGVLNGDQGSDTFTITAGATLTGAGVALNGGVEVAGDVDTLNVANASAAPLTVTLQNSAADGFSGTSATVFTGTAGSFAAIENIVGGADDTLQGRAGVATSIWTPGTYNDGTETLTFSGFGTAEGAATTDVLQGNDAATNVADDVFTVTAAGSVTLAGQAFTGIETLSGRGGADTFTLNADFGGAVNGGTHNDSFAVNATQAGVLNGDQGSDTFTIGLGATLSGAGTTLNGGVEVAGDVDTLNVASASAAPLTVTLQNSATNGFSGTSATVFTGAAGSFAAIENIVGGADDTLQGRAGVATSIWTPGTYNDGTETLTFSGFGIAAGQAAADELRGNDAATNVADDVFTVTAAGSVTLASQAFTGIDTLSGRGGADTFNLNADFGGAVNGGTHNDAFLVNATQAGVLNGDQGSDTFTIGLGATLSGAGTTLNGGVEVAGDVDTLNVANASAAPLTVTLQNSAANGFSGTSATVFTGAAGSFAAIDNIVGGADDTLQGRAGVATSIWTPGTYNDGTETLTFSGFGIAAGQAAADELRGNDAATNVADDVFTVSAPGSVTLAGQAFTGIDTLSGRGGADTFNLNANFGGAVNGGAHNDVLFVNASQTGILDGGAGDDDFRLGGDFTADVRGGTGNDELVASTAGTGTDFDLSAVNAGTAVVIGGAPVGIAFQSIESLTGNTGNDRFHLDFNLGDPAETIAGAALGNGGDDEFLINANQTGTLDGGAGDDDFRLGGDFAASIQGGADGPNGDEIFASATVPGTAFTLSATATGTARVIGGTQTASFQSVENATGNVGTDTFAINASQTGLFDGGENSDTFTIAAGVTLAGTGVRLTGGADAAGNDVDTLNVANAAALTVALTGSLANLGFSGTEATIFTGLIGSFNAIDTIVGNANDRLQGRTGVALSTWTQGTYNDGTRTLAFSGFGTAEGRAAADELQGGTGNDMFTVGALGSANLNGQAFEGMDTLSGLGGADDFDLNANFGGAVNGGDGTDEFFVDATQSGTLDGGADDDDFRLSGDFAANIQGGADGLSGDEIFASASATAFALSAAGTGTARVIGGTQTASFQSVENATGNGGNDTFAINASQTGLFDGGEGSDTFTVAAGVTLAGAGARLTGGVDAAGNDTDTLNVANAAALTVALTSSAANVGFSGTEAAIFTGGGSFAAIDTIVGNANDRLQGRTGVATSTWTEGTYNDGTRTLAFSGFGTAEGRAAADELRGGTGNDVFTVGALGSANLNGQAFESIETLSGLGGADSFNLNANFGGNVNGGDDADGFSVNASQSGVLDGGEGSDTFAIAATATLPGAGVRLTGGADAAGDDVDTLNVVANAAALTVSLTDSVANEGFTGTEAAVFTGGGSFAAIDNLVGSADKLQGRTVASTWTANTYSDGTESLTYSGITAREGRATADELQAGGGDDVFTVAAANSVDLNGQAFTGIDTLSGLGGADDFNLNANFGGAVNGGDGADEFFVNATQTGQLSGDAGDDDFRLGAGVSANVQGGAGSDEILAPASGATTFALTAQDQGTAKNGAGTMTFASVENLTGNTGNDVFDLAFTLSGTAAGGAGDDRFTLGSAVGATVSGDAGVDSLFGAATSTAFTLAGANAGSLTNGGRTVTFTTLESINGGAASDSFVLNNGSHTGNLELLGGGGTDTADVRGSYAVSGNLSLNGIETITDNSGGTTLSAVTLNILGASTVGESTKALVTNIDNLLVESSGDVFITEKNGLTILGLNAGTGRFHVTVQNGQLNISLLQAGGEGKVEVLQGNIVDGNGNALNIDAATAVLFAPAGSIGTSSERLAIKVPAGSVIDMQTSNGAKGAFIIPSADARLRFGTTELNANQYLGVTDRTNQATNNTLLVDLSGVDWASLDPTVTLLDCLEPCVRLPADQAEDEELARAPMPEAQPTQLLLIRTAYGWKMIPVVAGGETAALR